MKKSVHNTQCLWEALNQLSQTANAGDDTFDEVSEEFWVKLTSRESGNQYVGKVIQQANRWCELPGDINNEFSQWGGVFDGYLTPEQVVEQLSNHYRRGASVEGPFYSQPTIREAIRVHTDRGVFNTPMPLRKKSEGGTPQEQRERNRLAAAVKVKRRAGAIELDRDFNQKDTRPHERMYASDVDEKTGADRVASIMKKLKYQLAQYGATIDELVPITASHYRFKIQLSTNTDTKLVLSVFEKFKDVITKGGGQLAYDNKLSRGAIKLVGQHATARAQQQNLNPQ